MNAAIQVSYVCKPVLGNAIRDYRNYFDYAVTNL